MPLVPFLSRVEIEKTVRILARNISASYSQLEEGNELLLVIILKGALLFGADLVRLLTIPVRIDFVRLASYGPGTKSSGKVRILKDIETDPVGRDVLIIDEIADSGHTLDFLQARLRASKPNSVKICTLLSKLSRREIDVKVDFLGLEVEDKFLVGYGLDYNEKYRNLPDIYVLKEDPS